ncbi:hypothetical protein I7I48_07317 [Histoplasma ohiense]|nr:hypothetical protein I7I48_07317 [Histoplasma ohiense (nom. inval.)]
MTSPGLDVFCDEKNMSKQTVCEHSEIFQSKHHIDSTLPPEKTPIRIPKFADIDKDKDMQVAENDEKEQKMMQKICKKLSYH